MHIDTNEPEENQASSYLGSVPSSKLEDNIAQFMQEDRPNGPCFVYVPIQDGANMGGDQTHILDMAKTLDNSKGWDITQIQHYMEQHNIIASYNKSNYLKSKDL
jgi:hypothetical protein